MFKFDPRLLKDCEVLGKFKLCHVLLMRDANYPWCVLVPDRENMVEVFDLLLEDQNLLKIESNTLLTYLKEEFKADKMNVAALGNVVAQLHIHHIVRYTNDIAWPAPVWGVHPAESYSEQGLKDLIAKLCAGFLALDLSFQTQ